MMSRADRRLALRIAVATVTIAALTACGMIPKRQSVKAVRVFVLEPNGAIAADGGATNGGRRCGTLLVHPLEPAPGFLTSRMLYQRRAHQLEQFAFSRWADTPAAMLTPLVIDAMSDSGEFEAVVMPPAPLDHDLVLDLDGLTLLQVFTATDSEIHLHVNARLFAPRTRSLLGSARLTVVQSTVEATPESGVDAASVAVSALLQKLTAFTASRAATAPDLCDE